MQTKLFYFFVLLSFIPGFFLVQQEQFVALSIWIILITLFSLWYDWKFCLLNLTIVGFFIAFCYFVPAVKINQIVKNNFIRTPFINWIDQTTKGELNQYLKLFLINETTKNNLYQNALKLNIVHLFVISGFHLSFLFNLMERFLWKRWYLNKLSGFAVLLIYLFLVGFAFSALRVFISTLLKQVFKKQLPEDNLSLTTLLIILISNHALNNFGFNFSFLACFVLLFVNKLKLLKALKPLVSSSLILIVISPLSLYLNSRLNAFSVLFNLLFSPIALFYFCVSWIILPFIGVFGQASFGIYLPLKMLSEWSLKVTVFLQIPKPNLIFFFVYYGLLGLLYTIFTVAYYDNNLWSRYWANSPKIKSNQKQFSI
ncbi:ComEC/Rec2 family competence protein [Mycoplasmoides genitalium]